MPLIIPDTLPASDTLQQENIFIMNHARASRQDIRPLKIVIVNLMPTKVDTETQLARVLANSPLQVELTLVAMASHNSKHASREHMKTFYKSIDEIKEEYFDGTILTGAPIEQIPFEEVDYWSELCEIFEFANTHVYSNMFICWGAQAALHCLPVVRPVGAEPLRECGLRRVRVVGQALELAHLRLRQPGAQPLPHPQLQLPEDPQ